MNSFRDEFKKRETITDLVSLTNFGHFQLDKLDEIEQVNGNDYRTYKIPNGKQYPSITTILGVEKSPELEKWKLAVGEKYANEYTSRYGRHGTYVHNLLEHFLNNKLKSLKDVPDREKKAFRNLEPILRKNITKVYYQEANLYSNKMRLAGRVDVIGEWNNEEAIIDFKTSSRSKTKEEISNYFIQETAYSLMFEELTGRRITNLITIMNVENDKPIIFQENRDNWVKDLKRIRKKFYIIWNI